MPLIRFERRDLFTYANAFTFARMLCIPLFLWLLFSRENRAAAAWLLGGLGATDWVDGWLARRFEQVSEFGALFDPTVDRLMFLVVVPSLIIDGSVPLVVAILFLVREGVVALAAIGLAALGAEPFDVTWEGKTATFLMMFALPLFLGGESTLSYAAVCEVLAWLCAVPGIAYGYYTLFFQYGPAARRALSGRTTPVPGADGGV